MQGVKVLRRAHAACGQRRSPSVHLCQTAVNDRENPSSVVSGQRRPRIKNAAKGDLNCAGFCAGFAVRYDISRQNAMYSNRVAPIFCFFIILFFRLRTVVFASVFVRLEFCCATPPMQPGSFLTTQSHNCFACFEKSLATPQPPHAGAFFILGASLSPNFGHQTEQQSGTVDVGALARTLRSHCENSM